MISGPALISACREAAMPMPFLSLDSKVERRQAEMASSALFEFSIGAFDQRHDVSLRNHAPLDTDLTCRQ